MLSYQHGYHAGNFADVVKHIALSRLLAYLKIKDKPFLYLETHAGRGLYDFKDKQALKSPEYKQGIELLWPHLNKFPPVFAEYSEAIYQLNPEELRYYPGSPALAIRALRQQDRAYLCERHPTEFEYLNQLPHLQKKIHLEETDGIARMNALLPPFEKRGLIFIDPSYEIKDEYKTIPAAIKQAFTKFSTGMYCLWYPLAHKRYVEQLDRRMKEIPAKSRLKIEFNHTPAAEAGMTGCGLWIINPPFTLAQDMHTALKLLKTHLNPGISSYTIEH